MPQVSLRSIVDFEEASKVSFILMDKDFDLGHTYIDPGIPHL